MWGGETASMLLDSLDWAPGRSLGQTDGLLWSSVICPSAGLFPSFYQELVRSQAQAQSKCTHALGHPHCLTHSAHVSAAAPRAVAGDREGD